MKHMTPEEAGISSHDLTEYLAYLEERKVVLHDILILKGDAIVFEKYYPPFDKTFLHRQYSVSKSFVSLAVGFAEQDGLLSLDDPIVKYFPAETAHITDPNVLGQTIRHMLKMSTAKSERYWFSDHPTDRVRYYFENPTPSRPSGLLYQYDSTGSFVLGAMVERLCGKPFMEYLREKLFRFIGVSEEACCLTCPGGHSWGDSGVLCTARDLALVAEFVLRGGMWNGKQLLNREYLELACSRQIDNGVFGYATKTSFGYGYLIWQTRDNSLMFYGMGGQYAVIVPEKDLIFVCHGDNQGFDDRRDATVNGFFDYIVRKAQPTALPQDPTAQKEWQIYADSLELYHVSGAETSPIAEKINGKTFALNENPMGISRFSLSFDREKNEGRLFYVNAQGEKTLFFGIDKNVIGTFPQEGYSDTVGNTYAPGHYYRCASSAAWTMPNTLVLKAQIIDAYFGNALFFFAFGDDGSVALSVDSAAEDFLKEYVGFAAGNILESTRS